MIEVLLIFVALAAGCFWAAQHVFQLRYERQCPPPVVWQKPSEPVPPSWLYGEVLRAHRNIRLQLSRADQAKPGGPA